VNAAHTIFRAGRGKPELKVPKDNGVDDGHIGIEGRQKLAGERRLMTTSRSIQRIEDVGETDFCPFKTFQQFIESVLSFLVAADPVEIVELSSEKGV
jgi:hypothetical protein